LRTAEASGRPLGTDEFVTRIERALERSLQPRKPREPAAINRRWTSEMSNE